MALVSSASSSRMIADLILQATATPGCYVFSELLYHPNVQPLKSQPEFCPHFKHLQIFAHGKYQDYISDSTLPPLNAAQTLKLRQLTLLSLASQRSASSYTALMTAVGLDTLQELEKLVVGAIYTGLLVATLDPERQFVNITSVAPLRDVSPKSIPALQTTLKELSARCGAAMQQINENINNIRAEAEARALEQDRVAKAVEKMTQAEKSISENVGGGPGNGSHAFTHQIRKPKRSAFGPEEDDNAMDVDEEDDGGEKKRNRKKF